MIAKLPELEIPAENPWENDKLNRQKTGISLTELVNNIDSSFVLAIDGAWGTGKTTFINMWDQHLKNQELTTIKFNAWENDYVEDPLIVFITETTRALNENSFEDSNIKEKISKFKSSGVELIKRAVPAILRLATAGILNLPENYEEEIGKLLSEIATDRLKAYEESKETIENFKASLKDVVDELPEQKLVFFVDELDRCRPSFAIGLLEVVKHFFSIDGIVFVLSLDKKQLANSIQAVYGHQFDGEIYLRRFVDLSYQLTLPQMIDLRDYYRDLLRQYDFWESYQRIDSPRSQDELNSLNELIPNLVNNFNLTLRDVHQVLLRISISLKSIPKGQMHYFGLFVFLSFLKEFEPQIFDNYQEDVDSVLGLVYGSSWNSNLSYILQALLVVGYEELNQNNDNNRLRYTHLEAQITGNWLEILKDENLDKSSHEFKRASQIQRWLPYGLSEGVGIESIINKVKLAHRFDLA